MTTPSESLLIETLEALRRQVAALEERIGRLEGSVPAAPQPAAAPAAPSEEPISEETLIVLSAAIAAFLGKRPRIRSIRLLRSTAWAQEGRAFIQASHRLNVPRHK
jgi:methylmalonyl-CoA carboxyltransferase large subunit